MGNVDMLSLEAYEKIMRKEIDEYERATTDDERRLHEARLKDIIKSYDEFKSTDNSEENASLEREKMEQADKTAKKNRIWSSLTAVCCAGIGLISTALGIRATRRNMEVLSEYEREHYIATTAEKKAVEQSIDVAGMVRKVESGFKK